MKSTRTVGVRSIGLVLEMQVGNVAIEKVWYDNDWKRNTIKRTAEEGTIKERQEHNEDGVYG